MKNLNVYQGSSGTPMYPMLHMATPAPKGPLLDQSALFVCTLVDSRKNILYVMHKKIFFTKIILSV